MHLTSATELNLYPSDMHFSSDLADSRVRLAHSLGFRDYPTSKIAQPYLNYIENHHTGDQESLQHYLESFQSLVKSCIKEPTQKIQAYIDELHNDAVGKVKFSGHDQLTDQVMISLGIWLMSLEYFRSYCGVRHVERAFCVQQKPGFQGGFEVARKDTLLSLVKGSGLFPSQRLNQYSISPFESLSSTEEPIHHTMESTSIKAKRLNAYNLSTLANIQIYWTKNMSRHLLLSQRDGHQFVEVFSMPCALEGSSALVKAGVPESYIQEVRDSYSTLFSPFGNKGCRHPKWWRFILLSRWCWCSSCASRRFRQAELSALKPPAGTNIFGGKSDVSSDEFDPSLEHLMDTGIVDFQGDWNYDAYPCLWSRLVQLETRLQSAKPWRFSVLFRDKKDTLQFWTFFFATLILFLTVIQVFLAVVQVVASF